MLLLRLAHIPSIGLHTQTSHICMHLKAAPVELPAATHTQRARVASGFCAIHCAVFLISFAVNFIALSIFCGQQKKNWYNNS